jgi:uncharacterized protein with NRDE domain
MCLILVAWQAHPEYPLVVAANRDEFFKRPTAPASFWPGGKVLAGRDLEAGGTWMGTTVDGRFAALTNFRAPDLHRVGAASRGQLVADFLGSKDTPIAWLDRHGKDAARYNPFNLLVGDRHTLACFSSTDEKTRVLAPGIYGLSNHLLDTHWPKVGVAKSALSSALTALPDDRPLFDLLHDDSVHPDDTLPRTGVSLEWERLLSAAFVKAPGYGTRSSTVLIVSRGGTPVFDEQTWLEGGQVGGRSRFRFNPTGSGSCGHAVSRHP